MKQLLFGILIIFSSCMNASNENTSIIIPTKNNQENNIIQEGDIIFQTSTSSQSKAIQEATKSKYSHMGIIFKDDDQFYVFEAIQPVTKTPILKWISRGKNNHFVIKRLKDIELNKNDISKMKNKAESYFGKNYDLTFEWSDEKIYCSEYVWKIYKEALNIEVGKLQRLKDFDLTIPSVQQKIKERYRNDIPLNEIVISPESIYSSDKTYIIENPRTK